MYGHNTGPDGDGNPRVLVEPGGRARVIERPWDPRWHNVAMTVGGGTRVYQGMAWRMQPDDFRLASRYGIPDGSSLADWPITYEDLEPFYTPRNGSSASVETPTRIVSKVRARAAIRCRRCRRTPRSTCCGAVPRSSGS